MNIIAATQFIKQIVESKRIHSLLSVFSFSVILSPTINNSFNKIDKLDVAKYLRMEGSIVN